MLSKTMRPILKMEHIVKRFGEVVANDDITFQLAQGEILCLLGENGAGKTTLMNVLYGLWQPDEGAIYVRGQRAKFKSPRDAMRQKIGMVSQHFSLIPTLTVSENIMLGDIPTKKFDLLDRNLAQERALALAESSSFTVDMQVKLEQISVGEQQRIEILKTLYQGAEIVILDEPTAVLTSQETDELFKILRAMAGQGRSIIFITHKLREALLCDRIIVLRAGRVVLEKVVTDKTTQEELIKAAFGEGTSFQKICKPTSTEEGTPLLEVKNLHATNDRGLTAVKGVTFYIFSGEIMGIAGVAGNGQGELVEVITGLRKAEEGNIWLKGEDITNYSSRLCRERGIGHIPEERLKRGSFADLTVAENLIIGREDKPPFARKFLSKHFLLLDYSAIKSFAEKIVSNYDVRTRGINMLARYLSGGNIQKVLLAREFSWEPDLIVAAQPARGLDVITLEFVHQRLLEQREKGKAILLISYDLDEILKLSDRIGVMYEGKMTIVSPGEVNRNEIERMMLGASSKV